MNQATNAAIGRLQEAAAKKVPLKTFLANTHTASVVEVMPTDIQLACAAAKPDTNVDALRDGVRGANEESASVFVNVADLLRMLARIEPEIIEEPATPEAAPPAVEPKPKRERQKREE